ncbi:MAG TPA: DNA polymerase III subunit chi [Pseudomonas sp.]|nr:DNA polymerase III subunit chi [Pseudomonas sp.]
MDTPPQPANLPDWANDELPLLTETVGEPVIPLLSERLPDTPAQPAATAPASPPPVPAAPVASAAPPSPPLGTPRASEPLAQIERELHAAAQLIMQEVIDDYMLQIEAELHRRLEDHLAKILRAGRR